jgi:hypothetical protein
MIINIDICGAYAGNPQVYASTGCTGQCTDMVKTASNYDNAYWEISYVKTFTAAGNSSAGAGPSGSSSSHAPGATGSGSGSDPGKSGAGKGAIVSWAGAALLAGAAALLA